MPSTLAGSKGASNNIPARPFPVEVVDDPNQAWEVSQHGGAADPTDVEPDMIENPTDTTNLFAKAQD